jgi:hypothetical protein
MVLQFSASLEVKTQPLPLSPQERLLLEEEKLKLGGAEAPASVGPELRLQVETAIDEAFVDAFRLIMGLCGILALVSAAVSAATISNQVHYHSDEDHPPLFEIMG